jgi:uncharacterized phage infection (PIP) family protein YhgE
VAEEKDYTEELRKQKEAIEEQLEENQKLVELGEKLKKLRENPYWKEIIEEGYLEKEAERVTGAVLNHRNKFSNDVRDKLIEMMIAIRYFKIYLGQIEDDAEAAKYNIEQLNEYNKQIAEKLKEENEIVDIEFEE